MDQYALELTRLHCSNVPTPPVFSHRVFRAENAGAQGDNGLQHKYKCVEAEGRERSQPETSNRWLPRRSWAGRRAQLLLADAKMSDLRLWELSPDHMRQRQPRSVSVFINAGRGWGEGSGRFGVP